jgi:AcrR family transcriptional regulator
MDSVAVDSARLRAAEACCELYIARGTTDLTVADISLAIGVSQRTFYRYFPIKAESVSPVFDWTTQTFNATVADAPRDEPLRAVLRHGFHRMLGGPVAERTRALFPLVFADREMWSVFLRHVHDGERQITPILAPRLGIPAGSIAARAAAAAVASATRIALEQMVTQRLDAEEVFVETIAAFASGALHNS